MALGSVVETALVARRISAARSGCVSASSLSASGDRLSASRCGRSSASDSDSAVRDRRSRNSGPGSGSGRGGRMITGRSRWSSSRTLRMAASGRRARVSSSGASSITALPSRTGARASSLPRASNRNAPSSRGDSGFPSIGTANVTGAVGISALLFRPAEGCGCGTSTVGLRRADGSLGQRGGGARGRSAPQRNRALGLGSGIGLQRAARAAWRCLDANPVPPPCDGTGDRADRAPAASVTPG